MQQSMTNSSPAPQQAPIPMPREPKRYIGSGEDAYTEEELNDLINSHMFGQQEYEDVHYC